MASASTIEGGCILKNNPGSIFSRLEFTEIAAVAAIAIAFVIFLIRS
jgi:hypothetical protein